MSKLLGFALVLALLVVAVPVSSVSAATCTPTGFYRDGINLTAALINPNYRVTSSVDATGCNIGVYFSQAGMIDNADIYGANYYGVVNDGASVNVTNSNIHDIGETPFNGTQHGVGIYFVYDTPATGTITGNAIWKYQKGGIVVNGPQASADVRDNTVTGLGPVNFIAQNGIQFGYGASGTVRGNTISGNDYTGTVGVGPNPGGQNPPGWEYVSAGLLLYQPGDVDNSMNFYSGNQRNLFVVH